MTIPAESNSAAPSEPSLYNQGFWLAYIANLLLIVANSLTFRFAEFIAALGGTEELSGFIVSTGLVVAVFSRFLIIGRAIDRYGTRTVWLVSSLLYIVGGAAFLIPDEPSPIIWGARILYQIGLSATMSCAMVHIQNQVPAHRRTEMIGSLGTSGFLGTIIGTQLSDLTFQLLPPGEWRFFAMFGGAVLFGVLHAAVVLRLTKNDRHRRPSETPAAHRLLMRYWLGPIVLVAMAMGANFSVTTIFLTRFATDLHLRGIGMFFLGYAVTAFACRWLTRHWGETVGRHRMVLWGLAGQTVGQWSLLLVTSDWRLLIPAVACGFGHALLFPAVVSVGAGRFPIPYRGSGTTLVLGFAELGTILSAPVLGGIIVYGNQHSGTPNGFYNMFLVCGSVSLTVGIIYALTAARKPDRDPQHVLDQILPAGALGQHTLGDRQTISSTPGG
jgi:MFS family permease